MPSVIWKYELTAPVTNLEVPEGARFLAAGEQDKALIVWALVDPGKPLRPRQVVVMGTGREFPEGPSLRHVATVQHSSGLVWHVFEVGL